MILKQHQLNGVQFLIDNNGGLVGDEMGTGKTRLFLAYAKFCINMKLVDRILIVVPATLLTNWQREIEEYYGFKPWVYGSKNKKFQNNWVTLTNYEFIRKRDSKGFSVNFDRLKNYLNGQRLVMCCDEAGELSNDENQTSKVCRGFKANIRVAMDGTPIRNKPEDLYGLLYFIDPSVDKDWFYQTFIRSHKVRMSLKNGRQFYRSVITGYKNQDFLNEFLSNRMIRRLKKDCVDLPLKHRVFVPYDLSRDTLYRQCENLANIDDDSMLVKIVRLQEAASGLNPYDKEDFKEGEKLRLLVQLLKSRSGRIVVFFKFYETLRHVSRILKERGFDVYEWHGHNRISRDQQRMDWAISEGGILLGTIGAAGVGLNLVEGQTAIFFEQELSPSALQQAEDRIHRIGQSNDATIFYLYGIESVEQAILDLVKKKMHTNQTITDDFTEQDLQQVYRYSFKLTY